MEKNVVCLRLVRINEKLKNPFSSLGFDIGFTTDKDGNKSRASFYEVYHYDDINVLEDIFYVIDGKIYMHDFISIFSKVEYRDSKIFLLTDNGDLELEHFFDAKKLIKSDLNKFVEFLNILYSHYASVDAGWRSDLKIPPDWDGAAPSFKETQLGHQFVLRKIIVKYTILGFEDTIKQNLLDFRNVDEKLLYLNKEINNALKNREKRKFNDYEIFTELRQTEDKYMEKLMDEDETLNLYPTVKKWKKKLKILKRLRKETTLNIKEKNQKKSTPSTTKQQVLLFHYLEKLGVVKNFDNDKYFNGVENNKQKFLQHLFCRALPNVKKESINLSYPNRVSDIKTEANLKYLLELFKELKSKPLFDMVKKDCKEYDYHLDITYKN